jgi:hypothetical protein
LEDSTHFSWLFSYPGGFNFSTAEALVDAWQYFPGLKVEKILAGSEVSGPFHAKSADRWRRQNWDSIHFWGLGKDGPKKLS